VIKRFHDGDSLRFHSLMKEFTLRKEKFSRKMYFYVKLIDI